MLKLRNFRNLFNVSKPLIVVLNLILFLFVFFISQPIITAQSDDNTHNMGENIKDIVILNHGHNDVGSIDDMMATDGIIRWLEKYSNYNVLPNHTDSSCAPIYPHFFDHGNASFWFNKLPNEALNFFDLEPIILRANSTRYHYGVLAKPSELTNGDNYTSHIPDTTYTQQDVNKGRYFDYCDCYISGNDDCEPYGLNQAYPPEDEWLSQTECNVLKLQEGRYYVRPTGDFEENTTPVYVAKNERRIVCKVQKNDNISENDITIQGPIYNKENEIYEALLIGHSGGGVRSMAYAIDQRVKRSGNYYEGRINNNYEWFDDTKEDMWDAAPLAKGIITIASPLRGALVANKSEDQIKSEIYNSHFMLSPPSLGLFLGALTIFYIGAACAGNFVASLIIFGILTLLATTSGIVELVQTADGYPDEDNDGHDDDFTNPFYLTWYAEVIRDFVKGSLYGTLGHIYGDNIGTQDLKPGSDFYAQYLDPNRTTQVMKYKYCDENGGCTFFDYLPPENFWPDGGIPEFGYDASLYDKLSEIGQKLTDILNAVDTAKKDLDTLKHTFDNFFIKQKDSDITNLNFRLDGQKIYRDLDNDGFFTSNNEDKDVIYGYINNISDKRVFDEDGNPIQFGYWEYIDQQQNLVYVNHFVLFEGRPLERQACAKSSSCSYNPTQKCYGIKRSLLSIKNNEDYKTLMRALEDPTYEAGLRGKLAQIESIIAPLEQAISNGKVNLSFDKIEEIYKALAPDATLVPDNEATPPQAFAKVYDKIINGGLFSGINDVHDSIYETSNVDAFPHSSFPHLTQIQNKFYAYDSEWNHCDELADTRWLAWAVAGLDKTQKPFDGVDFTTAGTQFPQVREDLDNAVQITNQELTSLKAFVDYLLTPTDTGNSESLTVEGGLIKPLGDVFYASMSGGESNFFTMGYSWLEVGLLILIHSILSLLSLVLTIYSAIWATASTNPGTAIVNAISMLTCYLSFGLNLGATANLAKIRDFTGSYWPTDSFINSDSTIFPAEILGGKAISEDFSNGDDTAFQNMVDTLYPGGVQSHYHFKELVHGFHPEHGADRNKKSMETLRDLVRVYADKLSQERLIGDSLYEN